jgi:hypothetical protein
MGYCRTGKGSEGVRFLIVEREVEDLIYVSTLFTGALPYNNYDIFSW